MTYSNKVQKICLLPKGMAVGKTMGMSMASCFTEENVNEA